MFDNYHETHYTDDEVEDLLSKYLIWCKKYNSKPEVRDLQLVSEHNIGHIAYHANLL
jgi:hypothetical protein